MASFQYRDVERVLADVFDVTDSDRPKFHARIRGFRNMGLPKLKGTGPGRRQIYLIEDIHSLNVALALNRSGLPPEIISEIVRLEGGNLNSWYRAAGRATMLAPERNEPWAFFVAVFCRAFDKAGPRIQIDAGFDIAARPAVRGFISRAVTQASRPPGAAVTLLNVSAHVDALHDAVRSLGIMLDDWGRE